MNHARKTTRHAILLVLALGLVACGGNSVGTELSEVNERSASPVGASQKNAPVSTPADGTITQTEITSLDVQTAGPNTILKQSSRGVFSGTLSGSFEDDLRVVIHPNGTFTTKFTMVCECTVGGKQGVLTIEAADNGELVSPDEAVFSGRAVITGGTGELAALRGVFEIEGTVDLASGLSTYTYAGRVHSAAP